MPEPMLIDPLKVENWNNLLATIPGYSFFHTSNWADVLIQSYGYQPVYLCTKTNDTLESLFPLMEVASAITGRRGVSLPFTDSCKILTSNTGVFQNLLRQAVVLGKKRRWKYLDIRGGEEHLLKEKPAAVYWGHELDLSGGSERLFSNLRNSTRRNIKKAMSKQVQCDVSNSLAAMNEFCRLNIMTRKEHGLPPQPERFFQHLYERVISQNMGFVATASISNRVIAANVYLHFGDEVIYKYGASDRNYQHLRASNLVMWETIKWSCHEGFKIMTLGRTEPEHKGLMQFKSGWGAKPYPILYHRVSMRKENFVVKSNNIRPGFNKIISKLPPPVLIILGRFLYRHMG